MDNEIYQKNGFGNRDEYLSYLADNYGISISAVRAIAEILGENEDFDGLIASLEDYTMTSGYSNLLIA